MKKIVMFLTLISTAGLVQAAELANPFSNDIGILLSDEVLSGQRGKFVAGPKPHYFGIEFITSIAGPNGIITSGMQLNVDLNSRNPKLNVSAYTDENTLASNINSKNDPHTANNLPNGSGLVQGAQVTGNNNIGINDLSFIAGNMSVKGQTLNQGHYQIKLPDGLVRYDFNSGGLGMSYSTSTSSATQMLRNDKNNNGLVQQLSINGNSQLLSNQAKFYIGDQLGVYTDLAETLRQQLPTGIR
ncbi:hypothetical protein [Oceanisphaera avium]|uniref:Uncharacterized protein n=1 Tax=Oceanisphaera avium TaxID=1903694 RepID=A0A1Y0CZ47_9GAMM|nr:hypothetical protein [Oceanisphaera avium]ART80284.1 hypothetical protein CBP12_09100 [Oceanisphaera avium]